MASLTIRNLDENVKKQLRIRAAEHGRSMEEEVREILRQAMAGPALPRKLGDAIHRRVTELGGVEIEPFPREPMREPPDFEGA